MKIAVQERDAECSNNQSFWEDRTDCHAATSAFPTTEDHLLAAVAHAVKNKQKINVVSDLAHTHPKLACVGGGGLIISTRNYDSIVRINTGAHHTPTITVESGALMRDVIDEAAKVGLALPTLTSWDGVSAGGCISTGAHGSGFLGKGSIIDEYVVGMRLAVPALASQGYAKVIELSQDDPDLKAARLSLGTLGVISHVTFALELVKKCSCSCTVQD
ncbi:hypothetical protein SUGI_0001490 [Cryptomeria japonica]|nr:hypothetical protein SUGI_0001490 [Cryptomeria japonica]